MIKEMCTICIVLLSVLNTNAQYHPLLQNTDWFMVKVDFGQKSYFWYETIGDTTINNLDYKIVWKDSTDIYWVREDTTTKRVYIREAIYQTDFLVYDFGLTLNSSIPIFYPGGGGGAFSFTCDSIDYITTMAGTRKRIWVTGTNGSANTINMQWVEGVGNYDYLDGLFYLFEQGLQTDPLYQTVCAYEDSVQTFYDSVYAVSQNISCPSNPGSVLISSLSEVEALSSFSFYTNNKRLYLSSKDEELNRVEIFNTNGVLIHSEFLNASKEAALRLDDNLPSAIYILRVRTSDHRIYSKIFSLH